MATLSVTNTWSLLKLMSIESVIHPTISSSVSPFFSCPQSFSASGSFPMSQLFTSGGQRIGASASVLPMNIQDCFPLGLTGLISMQSKGLSRVFYNNKVQKHQFFLALSLLFGPNLILVAQLVKNPPAMWETWVCSLGWEDPLEKGKATHSSILAWRIPWTPWGCNELGMTERLSVSLTSIHDYWKNHSFD